MPRKLDLKNPEDVALYNKLRFDHPRDAVELAKKERRKKRKKAK